MATTASVPPSAVERSGSRRSQSQAYSSSSKSHSTRSASGVPPSPQRSHHQHHRTSSRDAAEGAQSHAANTASTSAQASRRSSSREHHRPTTRGEAEKSASHRRRSSHYSEMSTAVASTAGTPSAAPSTTGAASTAVPTSVDGKTSSKPGKSRTTIPAQSGNWVLGKTIGAGSMGKVKLARKAEGGEQVAVKIIPRGVPDDGHYQNRAERIRAENSKEVRTAREAAIVTLLDHPYICGMRDVVRTTYHWYMLFEYVNGGQMLDYIISHGRLREKQARKFSRQIVGALDYCHRNSIVHRDLKIENILISKTGDIKIIDFGLSNLFAPQTHLKTFCGSLYFAAPELLQAQPYIGPEVDIWSFGIVLYVLVCGKVPFDDQSMPALHAKIKKGIVDYPSWLSPECRSLLASMLVTNPKRRATLSEIMIHPWMIKGFSGPPENFLPAREPLALPLDQNVINAMTGFDFGPADVIKEQLEEIIESADYGRAVRLAAQEREIQSPPTKEAEKKRSFGFSDFYKRRSSTISRDTLTAPSTEGLQPGNDPVNAFHPLVSVYYLVREKRERDRFVADPGATGMPRSPGEAPLQMPDLPAPKAAHTNAAKYEMPGERGASGRSRPRARTQGEDDMNEKVRSPATSVPNSPALFEPPPAEQGNRKEGAAAGFLRRLSTRRRKEPSEKQIGPIVTVHSPAETNMRKSFSVRRTRERDHSEGPPNSMLRSGSSQPAHSELLTPPGTAENVAGGKGLGRSTSVNSAEFRRRESHRGASEVPPRVTYKEPPQTSGSEHSTMNEKAIQEKDQKTHLAPKASTSRTKSLGHARRESIQARRARREESKEANVPEETDGDVGDASGISTDRVDSADHVKPVFLKGLFSVSTTSTKPVPAIRADIIRVLRQLGVEYSEIRGGFSCRRTPSIDLKKVTEPPQTPGHKRKISFGGLMGGGSTDTNREEFGDGERSPNPARTSRAHQDSEPNSEASEESLRKEQAGPSTRVAGETTTHVQSDVGGSMVLEFEIIMVKVPLLSLHGIQFKRLTGGTWQYKSMADQILRELRL